MRVFARVVRGIAVAAALITGGALAGYGILTYYSGQAAGRARQAREQAKERAEQAAEDKRLQRPCADARVAAYVAPADLVLLTTPDYQTVVALGCTPTAQQWLAVAARQAAQRQEALAAQRRAELQAERQPQALSTEQRDATKALTVLRQQLTAYATDIRTTLQAAERTRAAANDLDNQERAAVLVLDQQRMALAQLNSRADELEGTIRKERPLIHHTDPISVLQFDEEVRRYDQTIARLRTLNADVNHRVGEYNDLLARRDAQTREINQLIEQANHLSDLYNSTLAQYETRQ